MKTLNTLYNEDAWDTLINIPNNTINLTVTSPPYNVSRKYDQYKDNKEYSEYISWLSEIFELIYIKTVNGGRICINIGDKKNGEIPLSTDIINVMREIGWLCFSHIIWNKNQVNPRTAWGSWLSPSKPSFPTPFEHILIFSKKNLKLQHKGVTDLTKEEFIEYSLAMWNFSPSKKIKTIHPATFPEELPYRCIKMLSYIGDIIYDPFAGIGTTLRVAKKLNRKFIGSEISVNYCEIYKNYINNDKKNKIKSKFCKNRRRETSDATKC